MVSLTATIEDEIYLQYLQNQSRMVPLATGTRVRVKGAKRKNLMDTTTILGVNERVDECDFPSRSHHT